MIKSLSRPFAKMAGAMTSPAVELRRLTKLYREGETERVVFRDVTATAKAGEIAVLIGRSGSGKSTLLNLISGIDLPTSGSVLVAGTDPGGPPHPSRPPFPRRPIRFPFHVFNLVPLPTV